MRSDTPWACRNRTYTPFAHRVAIPSNPIPALFRRSLQRRAEKQMCAFMYFSMDCRVIKIEQHISKVTVHEKGRFNSVFFEQAVLTAVMSLRGSDAYGIRFSRRCRSLPAREGDIGSI